MGTGRRLIRVRCALCGAYLYTLEADYVRVAGVCNTCVYREGGKNRGREGGGHAVQVPTHRAVPVFLE